MASSPDLGHDQCDQELLYSGSLHPRVRAGVQGWTPKSVPQSHSCSDEDHSRGLRSDNSASHAPAHMHVHHSILPTLLLAVIRSLIVHGCKSFPNCQLNYENLTRT